jgi:cyclophilin family peptidyl-prolyl cis-trans isomerase
MVFRLYDSITPRTAQNFKALCCGDQGIGQTTGKKLSYESSIFHRVIRGFMCQGGDFSRKDGTGGESIYGGKFADESFRVKHSKAGLLSMANAGPNTNGSQFFITFGATPHLDGKHVVFGELVEGMDLLRRIEQVDVGDKDRPVFGQEVVIQACGAIGEKAPAGEGKAPKRALEQFEEELERVPDKRHKKEKRDKKDKKGKKKSKKSKKSKSSKKSKKRRYSSSSSSDSSSDDSSVSTSSSSESEGSAARGKKKAVKISKEAREPEVPVAAVAAVAESASRDKREKKVEAGEEGEEVEEKEVETAKQEVPVEKPRRVDADGVVCRGRGNFKHRDAENAGDRGGFRGRREFGDRRGGAAQTGRYVPRERTYDRDRSRSRSREREPARRREDGDRRGRSRSPMERAERGSSDGKVDVKERLSRALGADRKSRFGEKDAAPVQEKEPERAARSPSQSPPRRRRAHSDASGASG